MPYFRDRNLEDQQNQDQGQGVQLSGSGMTADPSNDPNQPSSQATNSGAHFSNIDNYLKNNNGAALGQQVGQKVQGSIDQARQGIDSATGEVRSQIDQAPGAASLDQINQQVQKAGAGTTADDAKQYQGWTSQQYQGPNSIADNQAAQSRATGGIQKAGAEAKAVQTEPGRFSLLDQYFGRPNYSFGQKSLDNLLVQGGGGLGDTRQYQDQAAQLGAYQKQQEQGLVSAASQKKGDIEQSRLAARNAIGLQDDGSIMGGALGDFQTSVDDRVKQAAAARDQQYTALQSDLMDDNLVSPETLEATGLHPGETLYNLNLSDFLTKGQDPNRQNVATPEDYARYKALSQLADQNPTYLTDNSLDQAGKYDPKSTFDVDRFHRTQQGKEAEYNDRVKSFMKTPIMFPGASNPVTPEWMLNWAAGPGQYGSYAAESQRNKSLVEGMLDQLANANGAKSRLTLKGASPASSGGGLLGRDLSGNIRGNS